jgi:dienelactone hydrolase
VLRAAALARITLRIVPIFIDRGAPLYARARRRVPPAPISVPSSPSCYGATTFMASVPIQQLVAGGAARADSRPQIHGMEADPFFAGEGDIDAARALVESVEHADLFLYAGDQHLFADASLPSYDADAAALLTRRVLDFLATR